MNALPPSSPFEITDGSLPHELDGEPGQEEDGCSRSEEQEQVQVQVQE
jgi:hypothetical protein